MRVHWRAEHGVRVMPDGRGSGGAVPSINGCLLHAVDGGGYGMDEDTEPHVLRSILGQPISAVDRSRLELARRGALPRLAGQLGS